MATMRVQDNRGPWQKSFPLYCIDEPIQWSEFVLNEHIVTHQSNPSSRPSPCVAQLPRTLQGLVFSPPARPSCSLISSGFRAPGTSCLLQKTSNGTPLSSSSESVVNNSVRDVARRAWSEESMTYIMAEVLGK